MKPRSKILFVLVVLPIFVVIFLMPHGGYRRADEAYKQQLLARGEKLTIAELAPPPCTNPSNGATAFMQFMGNYTPPPDYPSMMKPVVPGLAAIGNTSDDPLFTNHYQQNVRDMAELRTILNAPVLDFNLDYSKGYDLLLPNLAKLKMAELLAATTAKQALLAKDFSEAKSDLLTGIDLVRLATNEPIIIYDLVRIAVAQLAINTTWEALQSGEWTDPQLVELEQKWNGMNFFSGCEQTLSMERAMTIAEIAGLRESSYTRYFALNSSLNGSSGVSGSTGPLDSLKETAEKLPDRLRFWRWKSSSSYEDEFCYDEISEAALESSRRIKATGSFVPECNHLNQEWADIVQLHRDRYDHFIFLGLGDEPRRYLLKLARAETARRLTVTAIALKRYHLQHGVYPAALNDLVPAFLSAVPADFMDGKPLRYQLRPDGDFLLYSVGEDGQDNGGDPTPAPPAASSINWLAGRDIVWPRVATPAALEEYRQTTTNAAGK